MRIHKIEIATFRLLRSVTLTLEDGVTVVVGRNNSGKSSLTELFRRLLGGKTPTFQLEDFSCAAHDSLVSAFKLHRTSAEASAVRAALPAIEVRLSVNYAGHDTSLGSLADFIIDLDPGCTDALISIRYELEDGKLDALFAACDSPPLSDSGGGRIMVPEGVPNDERVIAGRFAASASV